MYLNRSHSPASQQAHDEFTSRLLQLSETVVSEGVTQHLQVYNGVLPLVW